MPQAIVMPLISGAVSIGGSLLKSRAQGKAVDKATAAQLESTKLEIEERRRQFDKLQELMKPFVEAGTESIGAQGALAGLGTPEEQAAAIENIKSGPEFNTLVQTGENAILQNASATGGLRGGNVNRSLAEYRPQVLNHLINQRFGRLSNISHMGQASAAGVGAGAIQTGAGIAGSYRNLGEAEAQGAAARGAARGNLIGDVAAGIGGLLGNKDFTEKVF